MNSVVRAIASRTTLVIALVFWAYPLLVCDLSSAAAGSSNVSRMWNQDSASAADIDQRESNPSEGASGSEIRQSETTVGMPARLDGIVIQGPELQAVPIRDREQPFMVRVVDCEPAGDVFRYDLEYIGLEPGRYNLLEYLEPVSPTQEWTRSELNVNVKALLPPGQILPETLDYGSTYFGNFYMAILVVGGVIWLLGFFAIVFWGRAQTFWPATVERKKTLAEVLRPLLEQANSGELDSRGQAELERTLVAFWQKKLKLENLDANTLRGKLREHPDAGLMLQQLDAWLHDPDPVPVELESFLKPYRDEIHVEDGGAS